MDLRQLQAFVAVIDFGSFTSAARALHTVQSNISTHVARLETELGAVLIDRATGKPTQEGEAVLARARRIERELEALEADVGSLYGTPRGTVKIGIIGTTARWCTPALVDLIAQRTPDISLIISDGTTTSIIGRLLSDAIDIGVSALPVNDPEIRTTPLFDEEDIVIAPASHPLAMMDVVTMADLADHQLLMAAPGTPFRQETDAAFGAVGLRPRPQVEIDGIRLLASLAFQGFGVAIVPATAAPGWVGGDWKRIRVDGLARRSVGIALKRRGQPSAAVQAALEVVRDAINARGAGEPGVSLVGIDEISG